MTLTGKQFGIPAHHTVQRIIDGAMFATGTAFVLAVVVTIPLAVAGHFGWGPLRMMTSAEAMSSITPQRLEEMQRQADADMAGVSLMLARMAASNRAEEAGDGPLACSLLAQATGQQKLLTMDDGQPCSLEELRKGPPRPDVPFR